MRRILILVVALGLFLCSTASAFQGGGGEATKKGSSKKKEVPKKKNSRTKFDNTAPPSRAGDARASSLTVELGNNVKLELVLIRAGSFQMGDSNSQYNNEKPAHRVNITKPFYLGKYEVTQAQWQAVIGNNPTRVKDCVGNCPVEDVSWDDTQAFIQKLNEHNSGYTFRLPTEAEWEYAARAGTTGDYAGNLDEMAWYDSNSGLKKHPVGQKKPNAWNLYDMHGNGWEWCQDRYNQDYYKSSPATDPQGPNSGQSRVLRGGAWYNPSSVCRAAFRDGYAPDRAPTVSTGFRVVVAVRGTTIPTTAAPPSVSAQPVETKIRAGDARAPSLTVDLGNNVKLELVLIKAGSFQMGDDNSHYANEQPTHGVTISQPFYLGKYEVTQAQWQAVMGSNLSEFKGANLPVENVSWDDAQQFIQKLNARNEGYVYRLPTEAEWEYACRAGSTGDYAGNVNAMAWHDGNSGGKTHPVGQKQPNAWGLYDMHGNVGEWCSDWFGINYYAQSPGVDPTGPSTSAWRVFRGGSWLGPALHVRSASRDVFAPADRSGDLGFRLVRIYR